MIKKNQSPCCLFRPPAGISFTVPKGLDNETLASLVYTESIEKGTSGRSVDERYEALKSRLTEYQQELSRNRHLTRQLLWEEYRKEYPDGYGYTQFCEHYHHQ